MRHNNSDLGQSPKPSSVEYAPAIKRSLPLLWVLIVVCIVYVAQLLSPLRLDHDAIVLLSMAASAADGHGYLDHGLKTHYLPAYPAMVVCLERLGAARPWGLIGLNAVFLFLGLAAASYVARSYFDLSENWTIITVLLTALSWALIKHVTLPLTDIPFLGISMSAVALLVWAEREQGTRYYVLWAGAALLSVVAVLVRPVGIALVTGLVWSLGSHIGFSRCLTNRLLMKGSALVGVVLACVTLIVMSRTMYVHDAISLLSVQGLSQTVRSSFLSHVQDIGELALNAPAGRLGALALAVWLFGALAVATLIMSARSVPRSKLGSVEVYLATYILILILWPFGDPRFWIPVLPLILAELFSLLRPWTFTGWKRRLGVSYAAVYVLMGIAALTYTTRLTFSGQRFPYLYGTDEPIRSAYRFFYYGDKAGRTGVNEMALELLQRYSGKTAPSSH